MCDTPNPNILLSNVSFLFGYLCVCVCWEEQKREKIRFDFKLNFCWVIEFIHLAGVQFLPIYCCPVMIAFAFNHSKSFLLKTRTFRLQVVGWGSLMSAGIRTRIVHPHFVAFPFFADIQLNFHIGRPSGI